MKKIQVIAMLLGLVSSITASAQKNGDAGFGPGTVELFRRLWGMEARRVVHPSARTGQQSSLFD